MSEHDDVVEQAHRNAWLPVYQKLVDKQLLNPGETIYSGLKRLRSELEEAKALSNENRKRAERMADDWAEFCAALSLDWGDQQHAVNQIVAKFNEGAATARSEALEEAAKVADEAHEIGERLFADNSTPQNASKVFTAFKIAAAIRALKKEASG